ncbi:MAG: hypothetical protein FWD69_17340 [Polyangiaceae bacterium]|nr:hypothetical protein [Polyangiaceae bacterium]
MFRRDVLVDGSIPVSTPFAEANDDGGGGRHLPPLGHPGSVVLKRKTVS